MVYVAYGIGKEVRRQKLKCWYKQGDCKYVCIFHDQRMWASLLTLALILSIKTFLVTVCLIGFRFEQNRSQLLLG